MSFLALLANPVVRHVLVVVALISALAWLRHDAAQDARTEARQACQIAVQQATTAERERLRQVSREARAEADRRAVEAERRALELRGMADDLLDRLAAADVSCRIPDDVLRELRELR